MLLDVLGLVRNLRSTHTFTSVRYVFYAQRSTTRAC
jgi:hypothetical protein